MSFQKRYRAFLARHGLGHTPQIHTLDLVSEVGEVAKALLESSQYGDSPSQPTPGLEEELGDAFFSLIALAESLDLDLEAALEKALTKYETRLAERGSAGSGDAPASSFHGKSNLTFEEHTNADEG